MGDLFPNLARDGLMLDISAGADVIPDGGVGSPRVSMYAQPDPTGVAHTHEINTEFRENSRKAPPAPASGKGKKTKKTKGGRKKSKATKRKRGKKRKSSKTRL